LLLVENKAAFNNPAKNGRYPIHYAVLAGNFQIIKYILNLFNQTINFLDDKKNSLLHYASRTTNDLMIYFLISEGLNPNLLNYKRETALFNAVKYGRLEIVNILLNNDAFIEIKNNHNENVIESALIYNKFQIQTILVNYQMLPKYERLFKKHELIIAVLNEDEKKVKNIVKFNNLEFHDKYNLTALDYAKLYNLKNIIEILEANKTKT